MEWLALGKSCLTLCTSTFDIVSDVLNGLNLLGFMNSSSDDYKLSSYNETFDGSYPTLFSAPYSNGNGTIGENEKNTIWGAVGLCIIFVPGVIIMICETIDQWEQNWRN